MTMEKSDVACCKCKFFEKRTCFCRKNPPQVITIKENGKDFINSIFPKISYPEFDYCAEFQATQI